MSARIKRLRQIQKDLTPEMMRLQAKRFRDALVTNDYAVVDEVAEWLFDGMAVKDRQPFYDAFSFNFPVIRACFNRWCDGEFESESGRKALAALAEYEQRKGQSFVVAGVNGGKAVYWDSVEKAVKKIVARFNKPEK